MKDFFKFLSTTVVMGAFFALAVQYHWAISLFGLLFAMYMYSDRKNTTEEEEED